MNESVDLSQTKPQSTRVRLSGATALCCVLLLVAFLGGAAAVTDVSANLFDIAKIIGVVAFIGAMVMVAVGMVGDAFRF